MTLGNRPGRSLWGLRPISVTRTGDGGHERREEVGLHVWHGLRDVPPLAGSVVAVGVFDGVHRGHAALLARGTEHARAAGVALVVLTFHPHPAAVLRPDRAPLLLCTPADRVRLLGAAGAEAVLVLPFTAALAAVEADEFVRTVLVDALRARALVIGADFRFGARAAGDVPGLTRMGAAHGFTVDALAVQTVSGDGAERYSSSRARALLAAGDVAGAARILGRPHSLRGEVLAGDRRGRELGFPTANLACPPGLVVPADGVYAGWLSHAGSRWPAAISVGTNPTFTGVPRRVEAHVIDRDDLQLRGRPVRVAFGTRLRDMEAFDSVPALVEQMTADVRRARTLLSGRSPGRGGDSGQLRVR